MTKKKIFTLQLTNLKKNNKDKGKILEWNKDSKVALFHMSFSKQIDVMLQTMIIVDVEMRIWRLIIFGGAHKIKYN